MVYYIILTVAAGILYGKFLLPQTFGGMIEDIVTYSLAFMIFIVGIDIGRNKEACLKLKTMGIKIILVPIAVIAGTFLGSIAAKLVLAMPLKEVLAVGAGFGWYSLSGVLIAQSYSVELGATAFLANVIREMLAFILIPVLVSYVGKIAAIAPGGATTMDSTLPLITKVTDVNTGLIAFTSGLLITFIVPFLIPAILL